MPGEFWGCFSSCTERDVFYVSSFLAMKRHRSTLKSRARQRAEATAAEQTRTADTENSNCLTDRWRLRGAQQTHHERSAKRRKEHFLQNRTWQMLLNFKAPQWTNPTIVQWTDRRLISNYFGKQFIVPVIFLAEISNVCWFWLLQCEDLLLFFILYCA